MRASKSPYRDIKVISTGLPNLDRAIGIGGIPFRRLTEIFGPYSVGKTTLALTVVANAQKEGIQCLWCDAEWAWDELYASTLGVDCDSLELIQNQMAEVSLDEILTFAAKEKDSLIVLDAIGALHPRDEAEKNSEQKTIGGQAKLVATFCRRIVPYLAINNNALLVLNHQFQDIMSGALKTSGGQKLEYHKSLSISLKVAYGKAVVRSSDGAKVGIVIEAEIRKNKLAGTVGTKVELQMIPGKGFSPEADLLQDLLEKGEVVKRGNSYFRGETKLGVGISKAREWLKNNPTLSDKV